MPNQTERPKISRRTLMWVVFYAVLFYAVLLVTNLTAINQWIAGLLAVLNPLLVGLVLAYLANPFFRFFERRVLIRIRAPRARRALAKKSRQSKKKRAKTPLQERRKVLYNSN